MPNLPVIPLARTFRLSALPLVLCALACDGDDVRPTPDTNAPPAAPAAVTTPAPAAVTTPAPAAVTTPAPAAVTTPVTAVTFETRTVERREGPSTVAFTYPVITAAQSEALQAALTREIGNFLAPPTGDAKQALTPEAAADDFLAGYRDFIRAVPDDPRPWILNRKAEIAYQDQRVVSLRLSAEIFAGGLHGGSTVHYASFDSATGRRLGLADLFTPAGAARLTELGEREFRKVRQIPSEQSLTEAGFSFEDGAFALSDEVAVLKEGLIVYYNEYEIAPYPYGPTEIIIPKSDLAPLAEPDGPLDPGVG